MKLAYSVLKLPIFVLLLFAGTGILSAQNCYQKFIEEGEKALESFQFKTAIDKFNAAIICPDRPASKEVEKLLAEAQIGYISQLQLIASRYLTSEGQRAFQQKDYRLAFRLYQEALKYKSDNEQAKGLQHQLLSYLADYQYFLGIDPRFYSPHQIAVSEGSLIVVLNRNMEKNASIIKLIDTETAKEKRTFEIEGSLSNYQFSQNAKWLATEYYDAKEQGTKLSLWEVETGEIVQTFDSIYRSEPYQTFAFSENGKRLVYRKKETIENVIYSSEGENGLVEKTVKEPAYSLNVFDLPSQKVIYKTAIFLDYYSDDPESGDNPFRGQPFRQDLINEKISMKFSTNGVITTNNKNFVLKADEFRIRESPDFVISPDGKKFAFHHFGEEQQTSLNFNSEVKVTFGPKPMTLIGTVETIDLESQSLIFNKKSDYKELPQRFLPFVFSQQADHLIFIDSRKWTNTDFNSESNSFEVTDVSFRTSFNIYDLEKKKYLVENDEKFYDFFVSQSDQVITWTGSNFLMNKKSQLHVYDLQLDSLVFEENVVNEFSHFYDVKSDKDLIYFSTFDPDHSKTIIKILDTKSKELTSLNTDFIAFDYSYVRTSHDLKKYSIFDRKWKKD